MAEPRLTKLSNGRQFDIAGEVLVGRLAECNLLLNEGHGSRRHARLTLEDDAVWLEDLGSSNGTFVNGERIDRRVKLASGDRIRFDQEEYDFFQPASVSAAAREQPADPPRAAPKRPGAWADTAALRDGGPSKATKFVAAKDLLRLSDSGAGASLPDSAADGPQLQIVAGAGAPRAVALRASSTGSSQEWSVGSDAGRDVVLAEGGISSLHAKIFNEGARWKVIDQMSANGTFVNGKRSSVSYLAPGDRVTFGPVECVFQLPDPRARSSNARRVLTSSRRLVWASLGALLILTTILLVYRSAR